MNKENVTEILIKPSNFFRKKSSSFKPSNNYELNFKKLDEIENLTYVGEMEVKLNENEEISDKILITKIVLKNNLNEKSSKKYQYELAKRILKSNQINTGIFIFTDTDSNEEKFKYRFSLIFSEYKENQRSFSNFKRFTYFVSYDETNKTFEKRIINGNFSNHESIKEAFSVEKVTEEFYKEIFKHYLQLTGGQIKENKKIRKFESLINFPRPKDEKDTVIYSIKVISRLLFIWFLKYKKDEYNLSLIDNELISSKSVISAIKSNKKFTIEILNPILFEILNHEHDERDSIYDKPIFNNIPYLNGGLFSPIPELDSYNSNKTEFTFIENEWYLDFFETLEKYNFTIDENSPNDAEVSVDPEMLGKVFEELQAYINPETKENVKKHTGSFYTPKEIVNYMIDKSLSEYLIKNTSIDKKAIDALISTNKEDDYENTIAANEKQIVVEKIYNLKILDPACGSGAYPIGFLNKLIYILGITDPDCKMFKQFILCDTNNKITISEKNRIEKNFIDGNFDYLRKLYLLKNNIFGVDVQPTAIEITKLRSFLTLLIDQKVTNKDNRGIEALPNLDFKFVCANTLVDVPNNNEFVEYNLLNSEDEFEQKLSESINNYFYARGNNKDVAKDKIKKIIDDKVEDNIRSISNNIKPIINIKNEMDKNSIIDLSLKKNSKYIDNQNNFLNAWKSYKNIFSNQPVSFFSIKYFFPNIVDGFDIVIGNPPYVQIQELDKLMKDEYKSQNYQSYDSSGDLYCLFYEKGIQLLKNGGILSYITSNKWLRSDYGTKLRNFFIENVNILEIIDFKGYKVFKTASVDTNIFTGSKEKNEEIFNVINIDTNYIKDLTEYIVKNIKAIQFKSLKETPWYFGSFNELEIKEKVEKIGKPLREFEININYGIKTGLNEAFIINEEIKEKLISQNLINSEIIKPVLRGRDIDKYSFNFQHLYLLATGYDVDIPNKYPLIYSYLKQFESKAIIRGDKGVNWWNLRACAYYDDFKKSKIIFSEIVQKPQFYLDNSCGFYVEATGFMITGKSLPYLCGLLNSKACTYIFKKFYAGGGLGDKGFRYKKKFLERLPIPEIKEENKYIVEDISTKVLKVQALKRDKKNSESKIIEDEIDKLVYKLYNFNESEINLIEESIN